MAEQIVPQALRLGTLTEARYTLLNVAEAALTGHGPELYGSAFDEEVAVRVRREAHWYLDTVAARLRAEALAVDTAVAIGWAAEDILDFARERGVDAIALATHGRSGFGRMLLGSVADKVVRAAPVPVLVYRPVGPIPAA